MLMYGGGNMASNKELTAGKPLPMLIKYSLPLIGSVIFQQLYNLADSFVAGRFVGENALAAVGNSYEVTLIYLAFAIGGNIGCSVVVSQFFGAKRYNELRCAVTTALIACAVLCAVLMGLGFIFTPALLRLIKTSETIFGDSLLYLNIYTAGLFFTFFYNISTGLFTAMGDSVTPFIFLAASSTANILVDILFVEIFANGVAGVAWATFICQGISCVLAMIFLIRRTRSIHVDEADRMPLFSWSILGRITAVAVPSILQQGFVSVGNVIIQGVINSFGTSVTAGYTAAVKINNFIINSQMSVANGMSAFTAQNIGAGKPDRVREGVKSCVAINLVLSIVGIAVCMLGGEFVVGLFMKDKTSEALGIGTNFLRIIMFFYPVVSAKLIADAVMRGSGTMKLFMLSTFSDLLLRVVLAIILSKALGNVVGVWYAWPIGWTLSTVLSFIFYASGAWKRHSLQ